MKIPKKGLKKVVLKRFYFFTIYDCNGNSKVFDEVPEEYSDYSSDVEVDYEETEDNPFHDCRVDLKKLLPICEEIKGTFGEYDRVELVADIDEDGYTSRPAIIGIRPETDEEYKERLADIEKQAKEKEKAKEKKKQQVLERKKKQLEKLQKELS